MDENSFVLLFQGIALTDMQGNYIGSSEQYFALVKNDFLPTGGGFK